MFVVDSGFIGSFKTGDNINYNLSILRLLYSQRKNSQPSKHDLFNKLMIIINVTIMEAALWDFYRRCRTFTVEGVVNIGADFVLQLQMAKSSKFRFYIEFAERHDLFKDQSKQLYVDLVELSKLRNRIHIQNERNEFEPDDRLAFSSARLKMSEQSLERVLKTLSKNHPRNDRVRGFVENFVVPWEEHFPEA